MEAAISRAVRDGLADTTVRGIAEEAGVSLSTVHYCFASKSELLRAVARAIAGPLSAPVTTAITGMSEDATHPGDGRAGVEDVLQAAFHAYWEVARSTPGRQLLSYELTTWSLRSETGPTVARDLYDSFHSHRRGLRRRGLAHLRGHVARAGAVAGPDRGGDDHGGAARLAGGPRRRRGASRPRPAGQPARRARPAEVIAVRAR